MQKNKNKTKTNKLELGCFNVGFWRINPERRDAKKSFLKLYFTVEETVERLLRVTNAF